MSYSSPHHDLNLDTEWKEFRKGKSYAASKAHNFAMRFQPADSFMNNLNVLELTQRRNFL